MGRNSTSAAGVFMNIHLDCAIAIPPADFNSTTKINHFYINPGPISCFYDDKNSDVFLLGAENNGAFTIFPALRVYNAPDARTRFVILTRDHAECDALAKVAVDRLLPYEYRSKSTVCIPPAGYAPFLFLYFHGHYRKRNGAFMPAMYITGKYPELLRDMNLEGTATYPMQSDAPQKTNDPLCAAGRWDEFIAGTIRAFEAAPASAGTGRAPKRGRAAAVPRASKRPVIAFDEGCTLESVFEKLDAAARAAADEPVDLPEPAIAFGEGCTLESVFAKLDAAHAAADEPAPLEYTYTFGDLETSEAAEPEAPLFPAFPEFGPEQPLEEIFAYIEDTGADADDAAVVVDFAFPDDDEWMFSQ